MCLPRGGWRAAAVAFCLAAGTVSAGDVDATSTTLVWTRPTWRAGDSRQDTSLIQKLGLNAHSEDVPLADDIQFQLAAWGRLELGRGADEVGDADVDIAFVRARALDKRLTLSLGRQVIVGGAARFTHLDGVQVEANVYKGLGVSAYGGLNVIPKFMEGRGDAVTGARLFYRYSFQDEVGASVIQVLDKGLIARRDVGVDGRWAITDAVFLQANGIFSLLESRLADAQVAAWWVATPTLQVGADVRRTAPDLYIPRSSIFSVFAEEERDMAGLSASWQVLRRLTLTGDYHLIRNDLGGGHDGALRADYRYSRWTSFGLQGRVLTEPSNGYGQVRAFLRHRITDDVSLSADVDGTQLFHAVNGETRALLGGATVSYAVAPGWSAHLSGYAGANPLYAQRYEVIGRLSYDGAQAKEAR